MSFTVHVTLPYTGKTGKNSVGVFICNICSLLVFTVFTTAYTLCKGKGDHHQIWRKSERPVYYNPRKCARWDTSSGYCHFNTVDGKLCCLEREGILPVYEYLSKLPFEG